MAATLCILASSSKGNATAIAFDDTGRFILVDAGISPRRVREGLVRASAISPFQRLRAIFLTHLDTDHWAASWAAHLRRHPIPVIVRGEHADDAVAAGVPVGCVRVAGDEFRLGDSVIVRTVAVPHDDEGSTAYRFDGPDASIGHATDLGCVDADLVDTFTGIDLLNIESNYDEAMQRRSSRPEFLKQRIMGHQGHLSNDQCAHAVETLARGGSIAHVTLLHLSQECNTPQLAHDALARRAGSLVPSVAVAPPSTPTAPIRFSRNDSCNDSRKDSCNDAHDAHDAALLTAFSGKNGE